MGALITPGGILGGRIGRPSWSPLSLGPSLAAWYKADAGCYTDAAMLCAAASSQYASRAGSAPLRGAASGFWRAGWAKMGASTQQYGRIVASVGAASGWVVARNSTNDAIDAYAYHTGVGFVGTAGVAVALDTWFFWYLEFDGTRLLLSVDNAAGVTVAMPSGITIGSNSFAIGRDSDTNQYFWDGAIGRVFGGDGTLSAGQRTSLYAAGAGLFYADLGATLQAACGFAFNLCEASGNRIDSVGALNLTPTNGPTVAAGPGEGLAVNNSPVKRWEDQSGNARHLLQATIASQPLWLSAIQNGRPVLRYDGVDDTMTKDALGALYNVSADGGFYFACAAQRNTAVEGFILTGTSSEAWSGNPNGGVSISISRTPRASIFDGSTYRAVDGGAVTLGVFTSLVSSYSTVDGFLRILVDGSGVSGAHSIGASQVVRYLRCGRNANNGTPVYGYVDIGECGLGRYALEGSNLPNMGSYLRRRWATP